MLAEPFATVQKIAGSYSGGCRGQYVMLNVVFGPEDTPMAVLVRAAVPVFNEKKMWLRRMASQT